jgi:hypothetical protein
VDQVIPKKELLRIIKAFFNDKNRGISIAMFAELCGCNARHLTAVFIEQDDPLSEMVQRRVSKGYLAFQRGEVAVFADITKKQWVEYRKTPKPRMKRSWGLEVGENGIKLKFGIKNKVSYEDLSIDEQLKRGNHG